MNFNSKKFGKGHADLQLEGVDSFILQAWSEDLERELTSDEVDELQEEMSAEIQLEAHGFNYYEV